MSAIGQQLIDIVRAKAAEDPDFIYEMPPHGNCAYLYRGQPSCLIGHALWGAGLIDQAFERAVAKVKRQAWDVKVNLEGFDDVADLLELDLGPDELVWLVAVQDAQDDQKPWGVAVEKADRAVKELVK